MKTELNSIKKDITMNWKLKNAHHFHVHKTSRKVFFPPTISSKSFETAHLGIIKTTTDYDHQKIIMTS